MDSKAEQYAQWIVSNSDKKGTPEFEKVSNAYNSAKLLDEQERLYSKPQNEAPASYWGGTGEVNKAEVITPDERSRIIPIENAPDQQRLEQVKQGAVDDFDTKIKRYATIRFPKDKNAVDRYGVVDGNIVYYDEESGALKREEDILGKATEFISRIAPATAGGIVGGLTGGPGGAALGGAGGEAWRKNAGFALGDPQTVLGNVTDIGVEGVLNAAGWKIGEMGGTKIMNRKAVSDLEKFDRPQTIAIIAKSKDMGIDLTPAEASNLGSLISQQTRLGMSFDDAGDIIKKFYQERVGQVDDAVSSFVGKPPPSSVVGERSREVGKQYVDDAYAARESAAGPMYSMARNKNLIPEKEFMQFETDDYIRGMIDKSVSDPKYGLMDTPRNSLEVIDQTKKLIDDEIGELVRKGRSNEVRILTQKKNQMLDLANKKFPGYKDARDMFAGQTPQIKEAESSLLGQISKIGDERLSTVTNKILGSKDIDVTDVVDARRIFASQNKEAVWNDLVNVYLRKTWQGIKPTQAGGEIGSGAKFKQLVFGSKSQQEIMEAAIGPKRFGAFKDLMDVLEATGRVPKGQSMTEPAQQAAKREAIEVSPLVSSAKMDLNLRQWWVDTKVQDWQTQIAKVITTPGAIKELERLKKLRQLSPSNQTKINIVTTALTRAGVLPIGAALNTPSESVPQVLNRGGTQTGSW